MAENQTTAAPRRLKADRWTRHAYPVRLSRRIPGGHLPDIYNALTVELTNTANEEGETTKKITLRSNSTLGDSTVRTVALKPTDGLVRGATMRHRRSDLRSWRCHRRATCSTSGNILNKKDDENHHGHRALAGLSTATRRHSISWESKTRCSKPVSGIDLLTPYVQGGKIGLFGGAGVGKTVLIQE